MFGAAYPRVADREEIIQQGLDTLPAAEHYYRENVIEAQKAAKELDVKFTPAIDRELRMEADLDAKLSDADISKGDYGHRLRILVDEYVKHNPKSRGMRAWAAQIPAEAAESVYRKLRLAYTPRWHAYHSQVIGAYEDMLAAG